LEPGRAAEARRSDKYPRHAFNRLDAASQPPAAASDKTPSSRAQSRAGAGFQKSGWVRMPSLLRADPGENTIGT
jgi:hypothetical protein